MNLSWGYGCALEEDEKKRLLNRALDFGYAHLDTANIYGNGANETLLGEAVMRRRDEFLLASKMGIIVNGPRRGVDCSPATIACSLDESLKRLRTDHIDLYYMHRFDPEVPISESVGAMVDAIRAGKIGAYGVSEWSAAHIREAHTVHPMAAVQTEYSLWTRNVELGILDTTRELGISLVAFSPIGRGTLSGELKDPTKLAEHDLRRSHPRFSKENWPKNRILLDRFAKIARSNGISPAQLALAWLLARNEHCHAIPGTTNPGHLEENFNAPFIDIPPKLLEEVEVLVGQNSVSGHRYPETIRSTIDTEDYADMPK